MKAAVVGSGSWGTALALVLCGNGHDVTLWSRTPAGAEEMRKTRENPRLKGVPLPEALRITGDLSCLEGRIWWSVRRRPSRSGRRGRRWPPICGPRPFW